MLQRKYRVIKHKSPAVGRFAKTLFHWVAMPTHSAIPQPVLVWTTRKSPGINTAAAWSAETLLQIHLPIRAEGRSCGSPCYKKFTSGGALGLCKWQDTKAPLISHTADDLEPSTAYLLSHINWELEEHGLPIPAVNSIHCKECEYVLLSLASAFLTPFPSKLGISNLCPSLLQH